MRGVTHVLDTSAILAHYFNEPGAEMVERLWHDSVNRIAMCVLSLPELRGRLTAELDDPQEVERAFREYVDELTTTLIVDRRTVSTRRGAQEI